MYSVSSYGSMMADRVRMQAYEAALRAVIRPGCTVVDLGAGTGIFSLLACRLGAARVYAIEPNLVIHLAQSLAYDEGLADRIQCIPEYSTRVALPEPADVIVADIRGSLPVFHNSLATMADARIRLLAPGGTIVPRRDTLYAALVEMPEFYSEILRPWDHPAWELNMRAASSSVLNSLHKVNATPDQLLTEGRTWASIDYTTIVKNSLEGDWNAVVQRPGIACGMVTWFQTCLADGIEYSSGPGDREVVATVYSHLFFPWAEPVPVKAGDSVAVRFLGSPTENDYVWSWESAVTDKANGQELAHFQQSTFFGNPAFLPSALQKTNPSVQPLLNRRGAAVEAALRLMHGALPLSEIIRQVAAAFPDVFQSEAEACGLVQRLAIEYSA
jgi:protein arginine N-methyltransferase 1